MKTIEEMLENFGKLYGFAKIDKAYEANFNHAKKVMLELLTIKTANLNPFSDMLILRNRDSFEQAKHKVLCQYNIKKFSKEATVFFIKDNSGSMGTFECLIAESLSKWIKVIFNEAYSNVYTKNIVFNTSAKEVNDKEFNDNREGGGTIVSSGLQEVIRMLYDVPSNHEVYFFLFSDGDNLTSDCEKVSRMINGLNFHGKFNYVEVNQYNRSSTIAFTLKNSNFKNINILRSTSDIPTTLTKLVEPVLTL